MASVIARFGIVVPAAILLANTVARAQMPPPESWAHSCFVYRDTNRNGVFDLGDRPYAGLPLEVARPDGETGLQDSNIDGFANLTVALGDRENALVSEPGDYRIRALAPEGWMTTSPSRDQVVTFTAMADAGGGLVPRDTCTPIGVVPVLKVKGRFLPPEGSAWGDISVTASGPGGQGADVSVGADGRFTLEGGPGPWQLAFADRRTGRTYTRTVTLKDAAVVVADFRLDQAPAPVDRAERIDFDRLVATNSLFEIPSGYGGLGWKNWIAVHNRLYLGAGYVNATMSGDYVAYNSSGAPASFWSGTPFDFVGVHVGTAWPRGGEDDVVVRAWRGETLAHEVRLQLTDHGAVYLDAGYAGVTRVELSSGNYERIVIDDLRIRARH